MAKKIQRYDQETLYKKLWSDRPELPGKMKPKIRWKAYTGIGLFMAFMGVAVYASVIEPMLYPHKWQELSKKGRANMNQEEIQPGGMRIWSDPFKEKPSMK